MPAAAFLGLLLILSMLHRLSPFLCHPWAPDLLYRQRIQFASLYDVQAVIDGLRRGDVTIEELGAEVE